MILRDRCSIYRESRVDQNYVYALIADAVPCSLMPVSSSEKEVRGTQVTQTYLWVTHDSSIPFAAGASYYIVWRGRLWNIKGNLADVTIRGRLHHREAIIAYVGLAKAYGGP